MEVSFVLLHYNNIDVTIKAVEYIGGLHSNNIQIKIIIVDNASPNGTGDKLLNYYSDDSKVKVILNSENKGFARGNNVGYTYAKTNFRNEFIIIMNTDVLITDKYFLDKLIALQHTAEIICPDIVVNNMIHQNPFRIGRLSDEKLRKIYSYNKWINRIYRIPVINIGVASFLSNRKKRNSSSKRNIEIEDITPHGACIIFTKKWIDNEDVAFNPNTFMYLEEDILMDYIVEKGYHTIYSPRLIVNHIDDASTDISLKNVLNKRRFISMHTRNSALYLLEKRARGN